MFPVFEIKRYPLFRLIIPLIIGIVLGINFEINLIVLFLFLSLIFVVILAFFNRFETYKLRYISGLIITILLISFGIIIVDTHKNKDFVFPGKQILSIATIDELPAEKDNSIKLILKVRYLKDSSGFQNNEQKIIAYVEKDSLAGTLDYGDLLCFSGIVENLRNQGNPHEFDFKTYLQRKGISGQIYLQSGKYSVLSKNQGSAIFSFAYNLRKKLVGIYEHNNISGQELAVLSALTLGDKSELDNETKLAYSSSGAMHVLAVSGLHVGIIYAVLNLLLMFLDRIPKTKFKHAKIVKSLIIILFLWFFALISGLSPSVCRSAFMFSLFLIADMSGRRVSVYNSIATSGFFLLLYNPYLITDVGFQLSYSAVISIVYLQPKFYNLLEFNNIVLDKIWILICVSVAAQIGTLPVSLYYFHQFPVWFILTNIVVIPMTFIILYTAVFLLAVSALSGIASFTGYILNKILFALNLSVSTIEHLPFSVVKNISFGSIELIIIYLLLFSMAFYLAYLRKKSLHVSLGLIILFIISNVFFSWNRVGQSDFFVYNISKHSAYNFIDNSCNIILGDTTLQKDNTKLDFAAKSNLLALKKTEYSFFLMDDSSKIEYNSFYKNANYISFSGKKILILSDKKQVNKQSKERLGLDYLIVSGNVYISMDEIKQLFETKLIIFDSSNKANRIQRWIDECKKLDLNYFSVPDQGAFSVSFY